MQFRLLGPVEVLSDGEPLHLGSRKQKTVLAVLAANANRPVPVDRCLQAAWGEDAPSGAVRSLHTYVSNLRSIVDSNRTGMIERLDGAYRLNLPESVTTDWHEFERLARSDELSELEKGLAMWRGRPLQDVEDGWAQPMITSLEQTRLAVLERWADLRLESGEPADLAVRLEELTEEHPLHEPFWARLMLALYRAGRQADALAAFQLLRLRLAEELGIDPSPEVQELEERILTQDPLLMAMRATPTNLPAPLTETVGRAEENKTLAGLFDNTRLLTITGAGGVGKTTAAKELARSRLHEFPDGIWWFELAPLSEPSLILSEMMGAMRLPPATTEDPLDHVRRRVASSRTLLVFDNCEHLVDQVAAVVSSVLAAGEGLKVLATSREPLSVSGEVAWSLPPLSSPDEADVSAVLESGAGALFAIRAKQATSSFEVTADNAHRIASICRRLDGLPFAIELAAARLRSMGLSELEGRLDDRFKLLTGGSRSEVPHHQTLRGTVEWSYELLPSDAQTLYGDLSVFRGGFELEAAEAVSELDDTLDLLDSLVANSLVVADTGGDRVRYRMLETIREHAADVLEASGRLESVRRAHLSWLGALVRDGARELEGKAGPAWIARFRRETDNVRAALAYAADSDPVTGAAICGGLSRYWFTYATERDVTTLDDATSFLEEGRRWSQMMLDTEEPLPPKIRARLLTALGGLLLVRLGRLDEAVAHLEEAGRLWDEIGDIRNQGWATFYKGAASWSMVPIGETIQLFDRAAHLHEEAGDPFGIVTSKLMRGYANAGSGEVERARDDFEASEAGSNQVGSPWLIAHADDALALVLVLEGRSDEEPARRMESAITRFRQIPNYACLCHAIQTAGMLMARDGELEDAARCLGVTRAIRGRLGMVTPPYEDRTLWVEEQGLADLDAESRHSAEEEGLSMTPEAGIDWVLKTIARD